MAFEVVENVFVRVFEACCVDERTVELHNAVKIVYIDDKIRADTEFDNVFHFAINFRETGAAKTNIEIVYWNARGLRDGFYCLIENAGVSDLISESTEADNSYFDYIAGLKERSGILAETHTRRCSGC